MFLDFYSFMTTLNCGESDLKIPPPTRWSEITSEVRLGCWSYVPSAVPQTDNIPKSIADRKPWNLVFGPSDFNNHVEPMNLYSRGHQRLSRTQVILPVSLNTMGPAAAIYGFLSKIARYLSSSQKLVSICDSSRRLLIRHQRMVRNPGACSLGLQDYHRGGGIAGARMKTTNHFWWREKSH